MATGKIGRLPREIREQLNERLDAGVPGKRLVAWLNELPEVKALLAAEFRLFRKRRGIRLNPS